MPRPRTSANSKRELAAARKRRQRARERGEAKRALLQRDLALPHIVGSFAEFLAERHLTLFETLHAAGVGVFGDLASEDHSGVYPEREEWEEIQGAPLNSLNRATVMVDALLDAANELAGLINEFKLSELDQRIAEAEARSASAPQIEALHRIRARYRHTIQPRLPVYLRLPQFHLTDPDQSATPT